MPGVWGLHFWNFSIELACYNGNNQAWRQYLNDLYPGLTGSFYLRSVQTFSVPSRGLMIPGISSPNDRWSMRWEKLYAVINNKSEQSLTPGLWISSGLNVLTQLKTSHSSIITYICLGCFYVSCMGIKL